MNADRNEKIGAKAPLQAVDKLGNVGKREGRVCAAGPQDVSERNRA